MKAIYKILISVAVMIQIVILSFASVFFIITKDAKLDESKLLAVENSVEIYDGKDNLVSEASYIGNRKAIRSEDLNDYTINAFISIEDKRFYSHNGLNYLRMGKAFLKNILSRSFKEGASTISQQLVKNTHLTSEKTLKRKLKEIKLTKQLEKKYSKKKIMEMYLNTIYFGHNCFGIANASEYYFGKNPSELTVGESAALAGLIKSPNTYSPFNDSERCLKRRNLVLSKMSEQNYLNNTDYCSALTEALPEKSHTENDNPYLDEALKEVDAMGDNYDLYGKIKVYTYLDCKLQKFISNIDGGISSDLSICIGDNEKKGIKAYYSTLNEQIRRQPGSTIKPLLVYSPAIEEKLITPATPIKDEKINFNGYSPSNFGNEYKGYISARRALSESVNVPAVKILNSLGINTACKYADKLELPITEKDKSLALALGGMNEGFTLKELVSAYGTFSNSGNFQKYDFVRKIEKDGKIIYEKKENERKIFSEDTVSLINDILHDATKTGTAKKLKDLPFWIYAKTGTCGNNEKNTDAYTVSYTSSDTVGIWMGKKDYGGIETTGGGIPCMLSCIINEFIYNNTKPKMIKYSDKIVNIPLDKEAYDTSHCMIIADDSAPKQEIITELFSKNNLPESKSHRFSYPELASVPTIKYDDDKVYISLKPYKYFNYTIIRTSDKGEEDQFDFQNKETFIDDTLKEGRIYSYVLIPSYKNYTGRKYSLPSITTVKNNISNIHKESITEKEWWNE